ncbi:MAG: hypothetical protein O9318_09015 [Hylemonella sp.]|uniref:hypothetical protein n=1 Tax=Hylemonella sp. TaxID=2066020 RepID=UPI0022BCB96F|nr:hypothetical protein [Hylemonella sp.]MCZ8252596.1 hypothetical protein [Hylemonella sp.]
MLLILVDGKKSTEELIKLAAGMGESVQLLEQLEAEGLIEVVPGAAAAKPAAAAVAVAGLSAGAELGKARSLATRLLAEQLGPLADDLAIRLEAAKDMPQFVEAMKRAYTVVREVKGQAAADRFGAEVEAQLQKA